MVEVRRGVDPLLLGAMSAPVWFPVVLVRIEWSDGVRRLHSATGTLSVAGEDYLGVGAFGRVSIPGEGEGPGATVASLTLFGLADDAILSTTGQLRNRPGVVMLGALTEPGAGALIGAPLEVFGGYIDAIRFRYAADGDRLMSALQLDLGSGPSARQAAAILHSTEDQQRKHPGDTIMRHLQTVVEAATTLRR